MSARPLDRFVDAQAGGVWERALAELTRGRKTSHWMWFVFPQIAGLGHSPTAQVYAIADLAEARAYLAHPLLGARLREAAEAVLAHAGTPAETIMGGVDAVKLRSSATLFEAAGGGAVFASVLDTFFDGERDAATLERIG
jgi:uncharacterized protein (DUF1810 family)